MDEWFYKKGESVYGPVSARLLATLKERGSLNQATLVRQGNQQDWMTLTEVTLQMVEPETDTSREAPPTPPSSTAPATQRRPPQSIPFHLWTGTLLSVLVTSAYLVISILSLAAMKTVFLNETVESDMMVNLLNWCLSWSDSLYWVFLAALVIWQGCAFASLNRYYGDNFIPHGNGCGFWWAVPVANLFMPYRCLRILRFLSRKDRHEIVRDMPAGKLLKLVQLVFVLLFLSSKVEWVVSLRHVFVSSYGMVLTPPQEATPKQYIAAMATESLTALFAGLVIVLVLNNLVHQRRLYRQEAERA
jgi:hypothetical protein